MTTTTIRAYDLYRQLPSLSRPDLGCWLAQLHIYSAGTIEGTGMATIMDRKAAEYEVNAYCHGYPEAYDAALAWLDGLEVITDADIAYMQEVADNIDAALAQDATLWEAEPASEAVDLAVDELTGRTYSLAEAEIEWRVETAAMQAAGIRATQLDAQRLEAAPGLAASFAGGFTNVRSLDVEVDLLRMDGEDVKEMLMRVEAFGDQRVQVMIHRVLGYSVPVWVGVLGQDGVVAEELAAAVKAEWERLQRYEQAVAAHGEEKKA